MRKKLELEEKDRESRPFSEKGSSERHGLSDRKTGKRPMKGGRE